LLIRRASAGRMTIFAMNKRTSTRAAGVSPPWFGRHLYADTRAIARKTADSMWADHRCHRVQRYHGGLTPPALGCTTFVSCEKRHSRCKNARLQERRASARRGFPNRICKWNAMNFGVWIARAECIPRNAYAPPLVAACATYRVRYAFPIRNGGCVPRGAYAPRSWSGMRALGELWVFQLQIRPEHRYVRERAQHTCVLHLRIRYVHHGGVTPPALGCATSVRSEKRHSRCANACLQERRA
jgi:hypothetical protein